MPTRGSSPPKLMFVVTEDWFFWSHFRPMARAALAEGFDVTIVCRVRDHRERLEALGCTVIAVEADRRSLNPFAAVTTLLALRTIMGRERPDIVHLIALRSIILGGLAARLAGIQRRVIALTGMGLLGAARDLKGRLARALLQIAIRTAIDGQSVRYLFENRSDPALLGLSPDDAARVRIVGGAGIDPDALRPAPQPALPPLRLAMMARMLWSKGVDTAVAAVRKARARGAAVELTLIGAPDPSNPRAIPEADLRTWAREPGIHWRGRVEQSEIAAVYADHHVCLLPSRGGEGLPRTILEGAACGRAVLTTDVPGCRDFVRNGVEGFVVPPGDDEALASAILSLAADPGRVAEMGAAARARVLDGFTEQAVGQAVASLYHQMLSTP